MGITLHSVAVFFALFERALKVDGPLVSGKVVVLDDALAVEQPVGPFSFHQSDHFYLSCGMRGGVEVAFSVVGVWGPWAFIDCQDFIGRDGEDDTVGAVSHGLDPVPEIVEFSIGVVLEEKQLAPKLETPEEGVFFEVWLVLCEDVVPYLRHRIIEYYDNAYIYTEFHYTFLKFLLLHRYKVK